MKTYFMKIKNCTLFIATVDVLTRVATNSEYGPNTEYQIIRFLKMNEYRISNSTIRSQLFEYRILKIE